MTRLVFTLLVCVFSTVVGGNSAVAADTPPSATPSSFETQLQAQNVVWTTPSDNAKGSMPIGNGDIGLNVWVEPTGDLVFLVGKTDSWDENMRLLKLGKVRVKFMPALVQPGKSFTQTLDLVGGRIVIRTDDAEVVLWVDANHPVLQLDARSLTGQPISATAALESWRKAKRVLPVSEQGYPSAYQPVFSWPDTELPAERNQIGWYHRNVQSPWKASLELQKLAAIAASEIDPIMHLTSGGILRGEHWISTSSTELKTERPATALSLRLHVLTRITDTAETWIAALAQQADAVEKLAATKRLADHAKWWADFWQRSWIFVDGDEKAKVVTRAYTLQRFINACGGRGAYPIKFNGSIFVVEGADRRNFDADFRAWGGGYWFQNTRLPYWSMLSSGDFDLMQPFFNLYAKALPSRKLATQNYYGHGGAFFPETMTIWGSYLDNNYGTNRKSKPDGQTDNTFIRRYWQNGLEMVAMMLDYHDLTEDNQFRDETLIPFATEITTFFDQHWPRGSDGKIRFEPAQSLETWHTAVNPTPEIAGLRSILPRLQATTNDTALKARWKKTMDDLPVIPLGHDSASGESFILPAEKFSAKKNVENPELYAVFPFRMYTLASDSESLAIAHNTWRRRRHKANGGWQQNSIHAAMLGHAHDASSMIASSSARFATGFRFPAMWGPNYDWMPDQDHGSVIVSALQRMVLQYEGNKIIVLPAWPKGWSCNFKLHAPQRTTVEGEVKDGQLSSLKVTPDVRKRDVVVQPVQ